MQKADIWGFGSTIVYMQTPNYQLRSSLHLRGVITPSEGHIFNENMTFGQPPKSRQSVRHDAVS